MKDERYKALMMGMGMPNSQSLLITLRQVANEVEQEVRAEYNEKNNKKLEMGAKKPCLCPVPEVRCCCAYCNLANECSHHST